MIQAQFHRLKNNQINFIEISGHAESGPYGQDLVCAAVSALSIGTINSLTELVQLDLEIEMDQENGGYLSARLPESQTDEQEQAAQTLLESLLLSLNSVQEESPEYIKITQIK
ncbi:ribosomal-processing cysteine protease Prp [Marinilactibacillus piezotolerans]|uniref:ribosomal-processing cysteine protease Prp n=1 Tax=Marinilactibacillus piezotolerans TaxID=258723 RepID=UPI0009B0B411|nr:ribosomal-processing cysteine protease Prp [Marinilactibacillus piezotolerans]